jgi:sigma-B regulation protein RsbU (phosphoserine phosphatase)
VCRTDVEVAEAGQLQRSLLPPSPFVVGDWSAAHRFVPAGLVSGDYVDLIPNGERLYFMLGDVSGKGIAASMLMAELHAMFRTLVPFDLPMELLMTRASALVCVIANAGHPPPLVMMADGHVEVPATGVPVGMFCHSQFTATELVLDRSDTLLMYSDGLTEARNATGEEYGPDRVRDALVRTAHLDVDDLLDRLLEEQARFRAGSSNADDLTLLAVRRH